MQINRLFEIVYMLLDKKKVTAGELAEHFEVSCRTIYRDVEALSASGIPIYMSKGKGGGISLLPNFVLNKAVLTDSEKSEILSSLHAVNLVDLSSTETALKKVSTLFGQGSADWIEVDFTSWTNEDDEKETFNTIKTAIFSKNMLLFDYVSGKGETMERQVCPAKLCFKGQAWYLFAYCNLRKDYRFFKLRRIRNLQLTDEIFSIPPPSRALTEKNVFGEDLVLLKMKLAVDLAFRVYDEFKEYEVLADGSFIVQTFCPKGTWLFSYITSFGASCEVLEPPEIRVYITNELQQLLNKYL